MVQSNQGKNTLTNRTQSLKSNHTKATRNPYLENGCIMWQGKLYIPEIPELRMEIIASHHDGVMMGHLGQYHTAELVAQNYWWLGMHQDIKTYIFKCQECQWTKINNQPLHTVLHLHNPPLRPWEDVSINFIMLLPTSDEGMDAIVNINCMTSKQIVLWATKKEISLEELAMEYLKHIVPLKGIPHKVISNRGNIFISTFMKSLFKLLGIEANPSTAYHLQTDSQTERSNVMVEHFI